MLCISSFSPIGDIQLPKMDGTPNTPLIRTKVTEGLALSPDDAAHATRSVAGLLISCQPPAQLGADPRLEASNFGVPLTWAFTHERAVDLAPGMTPRRVLSMRAASCGRGRRRRPSA
jgi:hypothetical protein